MTDIGAHELVEDMVNDAPPLDLFFDRNPAGLTDDQLRKFIAMERVRRAEFITAEGNK